MHSTEDDTPEPELPTLSALIAAATAELRAAGVASPRVDAELLAAHVLGVRRSRLLTAPTPGREDYEKIRKMVAERAERVPLQHLTGTAPFHGLELAVGPGVFIPRFETELLVQWALEVVHLDAVTTVVDLCAGSGAIAIALAVAAPGAAVTCVERSPDALPWLRRNVAELAPAVQVLAADIAEPGLLEDLRGRVDLVVSNPPYVPLGAPVDVEVAEHDPQEAVFAGTDGLALMPALLRTAARLLRPGGRLGVEHDDTHGETLPALVRGTGWFTDVTDHHDLAGRPRFTTARRVAD